MEERDRQDVSQGTWLQIWMKTCDSFQQLSTGISMAHTAPRFVYLAAVASSPVFPESCGSRLLCVLDEYQENPEGLVEGDFVKVVAKGIKFYHVRSYKVILDFQVVYCSILTSVRDLESLMCNQASSQSTPFAVGPTTSCSRDSPVLLQWSSP